jgi:hypothetical protein
MFYPNYHNRIAYQIKTEMTMMAPRIPSQTSHLRTNMNLKMYCFIKVAYVVLYSNMFCHIYQNRLAYQIKMETTIMAPRISSKTSHLRTNINLNMDSFTELTVS